ncbi:hypothetical protein C5167_012497 [Papaver somniferum]|uniref:Uncharacterized protein n=1 Tax=Papaver somniferum TaxID=3469 RepID=A0A4Y7J1X4_PAPSO|nr:hypothetical protein C5167_012497 [Papaver somniferum]
MLLLNTNWKSILLEIPRTNHKGQLASILQTTKEAKPRHKEPTLRTDSTEEVEATQAVYKQNNKLDLKETQSPGLQTNSDPRDLNRPAIHRNPRSRSNTLRNPDLKRPDPTQQPTKP